MQSEKPKAEWLYAGTVDCFYKILREEGTGALFKGLLLLLLLLLL
jgi:hypothetical protein